MRFYFSDAQIGIFKNENIKNWKYFGRMERDMGSKLSKILATESSLLNILERLLQQKNLQNGHMNTQNRYFIPSYSSFTPREISR